jgi:hypothetical protein
MYNRGGGFAGAARDIGSSMLDGLLGLYVPIDAVPAWLPESQRYMHEQTWTGPAGAAVAHKHNGKLTSIQSAHTTVLSDPPGRVCTPASIRSGNGSGPSAG